MTNLRRHFNFSSKSAENQQRDMPFLLSSSDKTSFGHFDKENLMHDICNCLDLCSTYIQALNSVCDAGCSLARNLLHAVREVPVFQNVSFQFLSVWEEVSKATAGASAAVKTETLMMLQEILNALEMSKGEPGTQETITESFQVIGTCLRSFIELQAQFSLSTWKAFSKMSKHFTSETVKHSLQWKSPEKNPPSKIAVNIDLNSTIKKHFSQFSKVGISKVTEHSGTTNNQFSSSTHQEARNMPAFIPFGHQNVLESRADDTVWSPPVPIWSSYNSSHIPFSQSTQPSEQDPPNMQTGNLSTNSDLDEVINLLSCVPVQQSCSEIKSQNQNYFQLHSSNDQMYHLLPKSSIPSTSRRTTGPQPWAKEPEDYPINYDSWLWRVDKMNCSGLPSKSDSLKLQSQKNELLPQWDNKELQKWNNSIYETGSSSDDGSSVHGPDPEFFSNGLNEQFGKYIVSSFANRKHCSGESMPGGLENISESKEESIWGVQSKISTWPLKQSAFRNTDGECQDKAETSEY